jgi:hypothetical protein
VEMNGESGKHVIHQIKYILLATLLTPSQPIEEEFH